jgi:hypothetical protein
MIKFKKLKKKIDRLQKDLYNPSGRASTMVKETLKDTAGFVAVQATTKIVGTKSGALREAISKSWEFKYNSPESIIASLYNPSKLTDYTRRSEKPKSIYNKRKYRPYWKLLLEGFGRGGYTLKVLVSSGNRRFFTSPFNPEIGKTLTVIKYIRHPGKEARDWYALLRTEYQNYFDKKFTKKQLNYLKEFGF